jgi:hypothetical protein
MKILQGLTAMMSLAETTDKQLADFLNSAAVERKGDTVTLDLAYSSARLAQMIKNLQQQPAKPGERAAQVVNDRALISGRAVAEWKAETTAAPAGDAPASPATRTIEGVALKNGSTITLGRASNGGKAVRFERLTIEPAAGGSALVFGADFMRAAGPRGIWQQIQFPGADGTYTFKVAYVNDPEGKASYAVSVRDPKAPAPEPAAKK